MKFSTIQASLVIGLASLIAGVMPMSAMSNVVNQSGWIVIKNTNQRMEISFPRPPLELKFNIPFKTSSENGELRIYSLPVEKNEGLLVLSVLTAPTITEKALEIKQFKKNFISYLVKYLFNEPHLFNHHQTFKCNSNEFEGIPLLSFQFSYEDDQAKQILRGVGIVHENKLYQLFYLAPEKGYKVEILKKFVSSFKFINS